MQQPLQLVFRLPLPPTALSQPIPRLLSRVFQLLQLQVSPFQLAQLPLMQDVQLLRLQVSLFQLVQQPLKQVFRPPRLQDVPFQPELQLLI